jgi:xylulokinase
MGYLVGIDLGSTNLKAVVYTFDGRAAAAASAPMQLLRPDSAHPDWAIWDPDQIWSTVSQLLQDLVGQIDSAADIKAVAVTGLGMDGVPVAADGTTLYPFISWHCPRTQPQCDAWLEKVGAAKQFSITGNPVWTFNTLFRLQWMAEHEPAVLEKTEKWLVIEDFLNFKLCGVHATDYSMASSTLLLDQRTQTWSDELIEAARIDPALLCDPKPSGTVIGTVHAEAAKMTGLAQGTPVVLGGHDFLCGALATGAFKPGIVSDVIGTWEIVVAGLPAPVLTSDVQAMGVWVDSHVARRAWAVMASTVAADTLEWFRREYGFEAKQKAAADGGSDWSYLIEEAQDSPPGAGGVMFLPHMSGSFVPIVDSQSMGAFVGLRNNISRGDMFRAMIEGLNYQFVQMLKGFESVLGAPSETVVVIGGAAKNALWMQNKADVLGKPVQTPELDEAVSLGAAMLAGIGVGVYQDEQDAFDQIYQPGRVYEPDPNMIGRYQEGYEVFEQLYPALKDVHARIHDRRN